MIKLKIKKETIKKVGKTAIRMLFKSLLIVVLLNTMKQFTYASSLQDTKLVTGTENLVDAIISWLVGIGITVCGGYFIYYVYCLKTNDEGERRRNIQNIKTTLIAMVLITTGLALIDTILGFYK